MLESITALLLTASLAAAPRERDLRVDFTYELDKAPSGKRVDLWIPVPQSDERQMVRLLNEADLKEGRFTADKTFGNRIYYRRFDATEKNTGNPITLSFEVKVHEKTVAVAKRLEATRPSAAPAELTPYLMASAMIPLEGRIGALAQEIDPPSDDPLRAGRKIYDFLVDTMVYNHRAPGGGRGDAVWACDSKTGNCTDFHSVFIGVCRRRGIPADHVFGLPMPADKPEGVSKYCHCWARFWVPGVGWIPIDASMADKFPAERDYYFGTLGSTWLTMSHGRDVVLEPPQQGKPINMFDAPYAEVEGEPFEAIRWSAHYQSQPPQPAAAPPRSRSATYKEANGVPVELDVERAPGDAVQKVVVWIHGGALIMGTRASVPENLLQFCAAEGMALVSLDYRLAPEVKVPAIIEDIKDAFRWIRGAGATEFRLDTDRLVVVGGSAGGYLTMMTGCAVEPRPAALVSYYGYGDIDGPWLTQPSEHYRTTRPLFAEAEARRGVGGAVVTNGGGPCGEARRNFYFFCRQNGLWPREVTGWEPAREPDEFTPYCPIRNLDTRYPPLLLIHGTADTDVPADKSVEMARALRERGLAHELILIPDAEHGLGGGDPALVKAAHERAFAFIKKHLP